MRGSPYAPEPDEYSASNKGRPISDVPTFPSLPQWFCPLEFRPPKPLYPEDLSCRDSETCFGTACKILSQLTWYCRDGW